MLSNQEWVGRAVEEFITNGSPMPHTHAIALFFRLTEEIRASRVESLPNPESSVHKFLQENPLGDNQ